MNRRPAGVAHIARLVAELAAPQPDDVVLDPACGAGHVLAATAEYMRANHPAVLGNPGLRAHFQQQMFHGYDADPALSRRGLKTLRSHGVKHADIHCRDALAPAHAEEKGAFSLIVSYLPWAGSVEPKRVAKDLLRFVRTRKAELLYLALCLRLLKAEGRAVVLLSESMLFGATKAHQRLRRGLIEEQRLDAVIRLPAGVFKPHTAIATAILIFAKTGNGGTDAVWFYDVEADGHSLDDKRAPLLVDGKLGPVPGVVLAPEDHARNNLPDVLARWRRRDGADERSRARSAQSFLVPKAEIVVQGYDLSFDRYKVSAAHPSEQRRPHEILAELAGLEADIFQGIRNLVGMLK